MNYLYIVFYFACPPWDAVPLGVLNSVKFYFGLRAASTVGIKSISNHSVGWRGGKKCRRMGWTVDEGGPWKES